MGMLGMLHATHVSIATCAYTARAGVLRMIAVNGNRVLSEQASGKTP